MTLPTRLLAEAVSEIEWAAHWYDGEQPGLGAQFVQRVDESIAHLSAWPNTGRLLDGLPAELVVRRAPIQQFPYSAL